MQIKRVMHSTSLSARQVREAAATSSGGHPSRQQVALTRRKRHIDFGAAVLRKDTATASSNLTHRCSPDGHLQLMYAQKLKR